MTIKTGNELYYNKLRTTIYNHLSSYTGIPSNLLEKFLRGSNNISVAEYVTIAQGFNLNKNNLEI